MVVYEPELVKGFQDFLPPESQKREAVKQIVENYFKIYGFLPVETPTIEFDELMRPEKPTDEDEAISDRFRLQDKGGRNLGLRYEFTFQLTRIFKQNPNIKLPFRRYQIGMNFRDEPTGQGRFREFTQCDADIIGDSSIEAEAECLALAKNICDELKIPVTINVNNRKLINAIFDSVQIEKKLEVMREIDKLDKIGEDAVKTNLRKYADSNQILTLFKLLEKDLKFFSKNIFDGAEELVKLQELCKQYGFKIVFSPFLVRGLAYYSGNVVEIKIADEKLAIAAGGRYDKVIGRFLNKDISAFGISFGMERLVDKAIVNIEKTKAIIISIDKDKEARKLASLLRKENISCFPMFDKTGRALEYANSYEIPYVIFVGKEELEKGKFKLKNMVSGEEKYLSEKQIINLLRKKPQNIVPVAQLPSSSSQAPSAEELLSS